MVTATKPWVWQGTTQDGHRLILTRSGLVTISSRLKQSGLQSLVQQNLNGNLGKAILRAVAQIVNHARRSGLRSHPQLGTLRVFTAKGRSRTYQILTRPHGAQSAVILKIQSQPRQVFPQSELNELGLESLEEIEQMAKGKSKKQMTPEQIGQIKAAIEASLRAREHTRNPRTSTKNDHETALSRKRREQWSRAQRIFQTQGFGAALADMRR